MVTEYGPGYGRRRAAGPKQFRNGARLGVSLSLFSFRWFTIERTVLCVWGDGTPYCKEWGKGSLRGCCCCLACTLGLGNANGEWQWQCERRSHSKHLAHNQNALLLPILRLCVGVISRKNKAVARKKKIQENKKTLEEATATTTRKYNINANKRRRQNSIWNSLQKVKGSRTAAAREEERMWKGNSHNMVTQGRRSSSTSARRCVGIYFTTIHPKQNPM